MNRINPNVLVRRAILGTLLSAGRPMGARGVWVAVPTAWARTTRSRYESWVREWDQRFGDSR